jgi:hypothetical protein
MTALETARHAIDQLHKADPKRLPDDTPAELAYADHMEAALLQLQPEASGLLRLAARCQHLQRWSVPRDSFPLDKTGYHAWRKSLYQKQADLARQTLLNSGLPDQDASELHTWVSKTGLKTNPGTQALEDAACLVFLQHEVTGFSQKHPDYTEDKYIDILRKTWRKMSPEAQKLALSLELPSSLKTLLRRALG